LDFRHASGNLPEPLPKKNPIVGRINLLLKKIKSSVAMNVHHGALPMVEKHLMTALSALSLTNRRARPLTRPFALRKYNLPKIDPTKRKRHIRPGLSSFSFLNLSEDSRNICSQGIFSFFFLLRVLTWPFPSYFNYRIFILRKYLSCLISNYATGVKSLNRYAGFLTLNLFWFFLLDARQQVPSKRKKKGEIQGLSLYYFFK
jgi:hypothetical protein